MNPEFWRGRRVFLTGHTGFKGSWLAVWLGQMGAEVRGYALDPPTEPSLFDLAKVGQLLDSRIGDIRDYSRLSVDMLDFRPEVVLHLAAQSVVLRSYEDPLESYTTNAIGTVHVLDAVRRLEGRCAVVNVTTDKVYENQRWVWGYRETDPLGGRDPYSNSKACAELVAKSFRESFFRSDHRSGNVVGLASARAGNVIGGGDWTPHQLIPETIAALMSRRSVVLRHPEAIRPWQHVLDCLSGYLVLAESLYQDPERYATDWNFGPSDQDMQPVARVVDILGRHWGVGEPWVRDTAEHPHEELDLRLNSQKANRYLRWAPRLSLDTSLAWTAEWYRGHAEGADARRLCVEQVERYMATGA